MELFPDLSAVFAVSEMALPAEERSCSAFICITLKEELTFWLLSYIWLLRSRTQSEEKCLNGLLNVPGSLKLIKALNMQSAHLHLHIIPLQIIVYSLLLTVLLNLIIETTNSIAHEQELIHCISKLNFEPDTLKNAASEVHCSYTELNY